MKHTTGPIHLEHGANLIASDGMGLTNATGTQADKWAARGLANANRAVLCWNSHDKLLKACRRLVGEIDDGMDDADMKEFSDTLIHEMAIARIAIADATA